VGRARHDNFAFGESRIVVYRFVVGPVDLVHQPQPLDRRNQRLRIARAHPHLGRVKERRLRQREVILGDQPVRIPARFDRGHDLSLLEIGVQRGLEVVRRHVDRFARADERHRALVLGDDADGLGRLEHGPPGPFGLDRRLRLRDGLAFDQRREAAYEFEVLGLALECSQCVLEVRPLFADVALIRADDAGGERPVFAVGELGW